jgi:protein TonB
VVELGADDKHPERISGRPPSYPPLARKMNQQGRVTVEFVLTEDGIPEQMQIIESAGTILDQAVMDSLAQWRYSPAEKNGVKVRVKQRVRQTFRLGR